ncbi:hypothetical protein BC830DRAFT_304473 [Chytriomyces sp. MP71]|nr:hypothetical protein BC830DRAFT_304473 [Chytriomyces sp. MP71]
MEPLSIALFVAALGSIACSLILATRVWIFEGKKAISSNADIEAGKVPGIQLAVRTTPILTRPYEPKLTDTAFEIHVLREYPESIPVPDRVGVASAGPSASVSHDSPPHLQLSLHTDDEDRETMFRPSAYMKTMQSRTPSFASVASMEDKLDAEDYTAFSESFRFFGPRLFFPTIGY